MTRSAPGQAALAGRAGLIRQLVVGEHGRLVLGQKLAVHVDAGPVGRQPLDRKSVV